MTGDGVRLAQPRLSRTVLGTMAVQVTASLPIMLLGATAVQIRADLGFGHAALGVAAGGFVLATGLSSTVLGRVVDHIGATRAMYMAVGAGGLTATSIALVVTNWWGLVAFLALGGCNVAMAHASTNRMLSRAVPANRLGTAVGIKQAGPVVATSLAGLTVPILAGTVGWRGAFMGATVIALATALIIPRVPHPARGALVVEERSGALEGVGLGILAVGLSCAYAAITTFNTFLVETAVASGFAPSMAGSLLALAAAGGVVVRIGLGVYADRREVDLRLVVRMLLLGATGYAAIALGTAPAVLVGTLLGAVCVLGHSGLLFLTLVRNNPNRTGRATGKVLAWGSVGGVFGPPLFGVVVEHAGYPAAWAMAALWLLVAAAAIHRAHGVLRASLSS